MTLRVALSVIFLHPGGRAYAKTRANEVRFRMVIEMKPPT